MSDYEDELLREADEELRQDVDDDPAPGWGEQWKPGENEHRLGRYLGEDSFRSFGETKIVYLFVAYPGDLAPFYVEWKTRLGKAMEEAAPGRGDIVLLKRGPDKDVGQPNKMQRWSVRTRPCDEPLTSQGELPTGASQRSDIPFAPAIW